MNLATIFNTAYVDYNYYPQFFLYIDEYKKLAAILSQ